MRLLFFTCCFLDFLFVVLESITSQLLSIWPRHFYQYSAVDPCFAECEMWRDPFNKKEYKYKSIHTKLGMRVNFLRTIKL